VVGVEIIRLGFPNPIGVPTRPMMPDVVVVPVDASVGGLEDIGFEALRVWNAIAGRASGLENADAAGLEGEVPLLGVARNVRATVCTGVDVVGGKPGIGFALLVLADLAITVGCAGGAGVPMFGRLCTPGALEASAALLGT
jgi:hypothetical protein